MRLLLIGLVVAVVLFAISDGHLLFLPLLFFLPLGGLMASRRRPVGTARRPFPTARRRSLGTTRRRR